MKSRSLRSHGHDLHAMLEAAIGEGLQPGPGIVAQLKKVTDKSDYVRVRYMVLELPSDISVEKVVRPVEAVRDCVRQALNCDEFGNPRPRHAKTGQAKHANRPLRKPSNRPNRSDSRFQSADVAMPMRARRGDIDRMTFRAISVATSMD